MLPPELLCRGVGQLVHLVGQAVRVHALVLDPVQEVLPLEADGDVEEGVAISRLEMGGHHLPPPHGPHDMTQAGRAMARQAGISIIRGTYLPTE